MITKQKYFTYDFSKLDTLMSKLKDDHSTHILNDIKDELNRFFNDAKCINVLFNINTDKLFFGMCVMPVLRDDDIDNIIKGTDIKVRIASYYVEIDSKLLELNLSSRELTACLLHEVGHVINDTSGTEKIKNAVSVYLAQKDKNLRENMDKDREIYRMGIETGISKLNSIFGIDDEEIIADSFVVACGYGDELSNAYKKILSSTGKLNKGVKNKLITLQWTLSLILHMKASRLPALHSLKMSEKVEPSILIKNSISHTVAEISKYGLQSNNEGALIDKISGFFDDVSYRDIRQLEDELYEYNIRVKNCEQEDDALILTRELNSRISILDDLMLSKKLNDGNFKKCSDLKNRYIYVRKQLTDKKLYSGKYLGIFQWENTTKGQQNPYL